MKATLWVITLLTLSVVAAQADAAAGRVLFVAGEAQLERAAKVTPLVKGVEIEAGDLLVTGITGRVQLLMQDGDRIALRPGTRFRMDEFTAPDAARAKDAVSLRRLGRSFYSLLKGGFRTLTNSKGQRDVSSYRVRTRVATIGIRGTQYSLRLCAADCDSVRAGASGNTADNVDKLTTTEAGYVYNSFGRVAETKTITQDSSVPGKLSTEIHVMEYNNLGQVSSEEITATEYNDLGQVSTMTAQGPQSIEAARRTEAALDRLDDRRIEQVVQLADTLSRDELTWVLGYAEQRMQTPRTAFDVGAIARDIETQHANKTHEQKVRMRMILLQIMLGDIAGALRSYAFELERDRRQFTRLIVDKLGLLAKARSTIIKNLARNKPPRAYAGSNPQTAARAQDKQAQYTQYVQMSTQLMNELQNTERELVDALQSQFRSTEVFWETVSDFRDVDNEPDDFNKPVNKDNDAVGFKEYGYGSGENRAEPSKLVVEYGGLIGPDDPAGPSFPDDYEAGPIILNEQSDTEDGLYVGVLDGIVRVHNDKGSLDLHKGEYGYVRDSQTAPIRLKKPPPPPVLHDEIGGGQGDGSADDSFSNRRSPGEYDTNPPSGNIYSPDQPIQGTDPFGRPVDLTPGQTPGPTPGPTQPPNDGGPR